MSANDILTYATYELVDDSYDPETKRIVAGMAQWKVIQRMVHSKTWEATLAEEQEFPGPVNPGNLQPPWHLQNCRCTKILSQPLSKRVVETWVAEGSWEVIESYDNPDDLPWNNAGV